MLRAHGRQLPPAPRRLAVAVLALVGGLGMAPGVWTQSPPAFIAPQIYLQDTVWFLGQQIIRLDRFSPDFFDKTTVRWFVDEQPLPEYDGQLGLRLDKPRDGAWHTITVRIPRTDQPGVVFEQSARFQAFKALELAAPTQSAATARKRGIAVRVSAARGYYRLRSLSARIPAAGGVNFDDRRGGVKTIRLRGSYLDRIKPGTRLTIRAQRHYRGSILETAVVTVRFR